MTPAHLVNRSRSRYERGLRTASAQITPDNSFNQVSMTGGADLP
jgi:hypothetical protein